MRELSDFDEMYQEVIIDHYQKQTQYLRGKDNNLAKITKKFCEEEIMKAK